MANIMPVLFDPAPPKVDYYTYFKNLLSYDGGLNNHLKIIAGCDSLHDFNDKGGRVPEVTWNAVSKNLLTNLKSLDPESNVNSEFASWTKSVSGGKITPSSIEDKTVSYFESNYQPQLRGTTVLLTYRQVIKKINNFMSIKDTKINDAILQANIALCDGAQILEIDMAAGEVWDMAYTTQDKLYIGLFLLNFYFPPSVTTSSSTGAAAKLHAAQSSTTHNGDVDVDYNTRLQTYMTFDAGSNIPSKIFGLLNQVINLVTPLNIADSATESQHLAVDISQKRAGVKNKYVFPINNDDGSDGRYIYSSNIFTMKEGIQLSITPPSGEYGETNKYNFSINVAEIPPPSSNPLIPNPCELVKFTTIDKNGTTTYKSGPGVEYLSECINKNFESAAPAITTIAPIVSSCADNSNNKALYFDLKRSGDWEQCLAALTVNKFMDGVQKGRVILCTIDRLCGLFSRCIGQNTLYHYGTRLILYRYEVSLTEGQIAAAKKAAEAARAAAAEAAAQAAEAIKKEVEEAYKNFYQNFKDNFTISKFKKPNPTNPNPNPKDVASLNLYNLINYFARKLVINGLNKLKYAAAPVAAAPVAAPAAAAAAADNDDSNDTQGNGSGSIDVKDIDSSDTQGNGSGSIDVEDTDSNRKRTANTDSDTDNNKIPKYNQNYSTYFSKLKEITGIYVNSINYQPFIDNINSFFNKLNNLQALPTGIFCDYNSEMLINLFLKLQQIVVFNRLARQTKSLGIDNYKMLLESAGVFDTLELILNNSPDDNNLKNFVKNFKEVQYSHVPADAAPVPGVTDLNMNYYEKLKLILDTYIRGATEEEEVAEKAAAEEVAEKAATNNGQGTKRERESDADADPGLEFKKKTDNSASNNKTGGHPLSVKQQENGSDTLMFELTTLFMSLTVNLNELTETLFLDSSFNDYYNKFSLVMKSKNIPDTYTDKILQILDNFFRESWFAIKKAEAVNLDTTEHKKIYYTVYIFFACLYGDINKDFISFLNDNNLYNQDKIVNNVYNVEKYLIVDNSFFNDYIDDKDDEIKRILYALWLEEDKLVYFKNIINYCINQRFADDADLPDRAAATATAATASAAAARAAAFSATASDAARDAAAAAPAAAASKAHVASDSALPARPINNFVLTIFTTLFNFFNYCIYYSVRDAAAAAPSAATDKDIGFNEGNIKISDFKDSTITTSFINFINKVIEINKLNKLNNIIESQELIFKKIYILLSIFSHYYQSSDKTITQINELYGLSGGSKKYTKKIYNNRKNKTKHKSRNNKGGKRNTKKYNDKRKKRNTKRINNT